MKLTRRLKRTPLFSDIRIKIKIKINNILNYTYMRNFEVQKLTAILWMDSVLAKDRADSSSGGS